MEEIIVEDEMLDDLEVEMLQEFKFDERNIFHRKENVDQNNYQVNIVELELDLDNIEEEENDNNVGFDVENDINWDTTNFLLSEKYPSYNYVPIFSLQRISPPKHEVDSKIEEHSQKYFYPDLITVDKLYNYFTNEEEHLILKDFKKNTAVGFFQFGFEQGHYQVPNTRDAMYHLLNNINYFCDTNLTKTSLSSHETLHSDYFQLKYKLTEVSKKYIPMPNKLYYCYDSSHPKDDTRFEKIYVFKYFKSPFCETCNKKIDISSYILIYDAREAVTFHLFRQKEETINYLLEYNRKQKMKKNTCFSDSTEVNDFDTGLFVHIASQYDFYEGDISLAFLFNCDGVNTKRKSNLYKDVVVCTKV